MKNKILLIPFLCLSSLGANAQSVIQQPTAVNESGTAPDASAILDLQAAGKGVLVPRMTTAARTAIASPATGLLVFDTDSGKLWFFNGTAWQAVSTTATLSDADNDTKVQVEESPDEDIIRFDMAGTEVGRMDGKTFHLAAPGGSLFIGNGAGQSDDGTDNSNTFVGVDAGSANTTGNQNTASGANALFSNTTGSGNTAVGAQALLSNTEGFDNTAVGVSTLRSNSNGYRNTASGFFALYTNLVGNNNTVNGYGAMYKNETGSENVALGSLSLFNNLHGTYNTALGNEGLHQNWLGSYNTATGYKAGSLGTTNNLCTAIGAFTDVATALDNYTNATALGFAANTAADNAVRIGNTSVTSIGGQVAWTNFSDGRFKRQVREDVAGMDFIARLRPVTYHWDIRALNDFIPGTNDSLDWNSKYDIEQMRFSGFIAQEVEEAARQAGYDFSGVDKPQNEHSPYGLRYSEFVVPIVKAMQEQQAVIEQQQATIERQAAEIDRLKLLEAQLGKITAALRGAGINVEE